MQTEAGVQQIEFVYNPMGQRVLKIVKDYVSSSYNESASNNWRYTYYTYDANGQVMTTYDLINNTVTNVKTATLDEQMLYGMSRLGVKSNAMTIYTNQQSLAPESSIWQNKVGKKNYELTNHLGNVNVVITDRKVVNTNYVVNTFTSSTNSWSACTNASLATGATAMTVTSTGASNNCTYKVFTTTANTPYVVRVKSAKGTVSAGLRVSIWGGATLLQQVPLADNDFSHVVFTANGANVTIILEPISGNGVYTVDEVSLTPNSIYEAVSVMKADYYPYGMDNLSRNEVFGMPSRVTNSGAYRYAYNGMEVDPETKGNGNSYTTEFRQYDPRLGRWLSVDPLAAAAPVWTPYRAFFNNPIIHTDPSGLFEDRKDARQYKKAHGIDGKIRKNENGTFSIYDHKASACYTKATGSDYLFYLGQGMIDIEGVLSEPMVSPKEETPKIVLMGGGDFNNTGELGRNDAMANALGTYVQQTGQNYNAGDIHVINSAMWANSDSDKEIVQPIADIIQGMSDKGGPVILYGYSFGAHILSWVLEELDRRGIIVDVLITVDQASGPGTILSGEDRSLPDNVKYNINFYQGWPSPVLSYGGVNEGINKVVNVNLTNTTNSKGESIKHSNIDEYTEAFITYYLYQYFKGSNKLERLSEKQIRQQLRKFERMQNK